MAGSNGRLSVGFAAVPLEKVFQECAHQITGLGGHSLSDVKIGLLWIILVPLFLSFARGCRMCQEESESPGRSLS